MMEYLDLANEQKSRVLDRVAALEEWRQRTSANARFWSPLQIVEHLVLFEKEYVHFIEEGTRQGVNARRPSHSPVIPVLLWLMRNRISFPTIAPMTPPENPRSLAESRNDWDGVRAALEAALARSAGDSPVMLNPLLGPLTASQVLRLLSAHQEYHLAQIPRK